jgi:hypothetical protein
MLPCTTPGHLYCIDVETTNAGIPYADSFSVFSHYCMTSISDNESSFAVFSQIRYKKNVWGFVKSKFYLKSMYQISYRAFIYYLNNTGFIDKNCWAGMQEYFNSLIKALAVECEESSVVAGGLKRKARRRRRVTTAGVTIQTHSPDHTAFNHQSPVVDLPHSRNINGNISKMKEIKKLLMIMYAFIN